MKWHIEAVVKNGLIYSLEPLPPEWTEGSELAIQLVYAPPIHEELQTDQGEANGVATTDAADDARLDAALAEADAKAKAIVRREMGLSG